jgi:hypothetical protein
MGDGGWGKNWFNWFNSWVRLCAGWGAGDYLRGIFWVVRAWRRARPRLDLIWR